MTNTEKVSPLLMRAGSGMTMAASRSWRRRSRLANMPPRNLASELGMRAFTRTALVKARIPNSEAKLRGGMFASLDLRLHLRDAAIVIPEPALMSNGDTFSVFVIDEKSSAQVRLVEVGLRLAGRAEIVKGLNAGEMVVVEGTQKLRPGAPVKLAPAEATAPYLDSEKEKPDGTHTKA